MRYGGVKWEKDGVSVHPDALVESCNIGTGTRVWAFAHIMKGASVGKECNICDHTFIEGNVRIGNYVTVKNGISIWDGVTIEDYVFLGPNVAFTNDRNPRAAIKKSGMQLEKTLIRKGATIGANATVLCGVVVGSYAFIAAGAVLTADAPSYSLMMGVPARLVGWMCVCAEKLKLSSGRAKCKKCGRTYKRIGESLSEIK